MAIKTSTFGGWELSGEHADAFMKQFYDDTPNPLAVAAFQRGEKLVKEYIEKGYATIKPDKWEES